MPAWQELIRNRWVWVAAGGGALVGLVVLIRRRGQSGGASSPAPEEAPGYGPSGLGYFDSSATDFAEILGQYQAGFQRMFDEFTQEVNRRLADIPAAPETPQQPPSSGKKPSRVITPPAVIWPSWLPPSVSPAPPPSQSPSYTPPTRR
jgi:hypothetical protein